MKSEDLAFQHKYLMSLNHKARRQARWYMATVKCDIERDGLQCTFCDGVGFYFSGVRFGFGCMNKDCIANVFAAISFLGVKALKRDER